MIRRAGQAICTCAGGIRRQLVSDDWRIACCRCHRIAYNRQRAGTSQSPRKMGRLIQALLADYWSEPWMAPDPTPLLFIVMAASTVLEAETQRLPVREGGDPCP